MLQYWPIVLEGAEPLVQKYSIFKDPLMIIIAVFAILYIVLMIIKKVRSPKKTGKKEVRVQIVSVEKLRAVIQNTDRGRALGNNTAMPSSVAQVSFKEMDTNEVHTYSVKEAECTGWHEGDIGILTYNGGDYLGFEKSH